MSIILYRFAFNSRVAVNSVMFKTKANYQVRMSRIDPCRRLRKLHSHFDVRDVSRQTVIRSRTSESVESFGQRQFPGYETLSID